MTLPIQARRISSTPALRGLRRALIIAVVIGLGVQVAAQTNISWNVNGGGSWSNSANWSPANIPNTGSEVAIFNQANGGTIDWTANLTVGGITFNGSAGAFTISKTSGATRTLTIGQYGITNNDDSTQTITGADMRLTLGTVASAFTVAGAGDLVISTTGGTIATTGTAALTLTGNGSGLGSISSVISGAGLLTKSGTGTWQLSGNNTYTGGTNLAGGTLVADSANALSTSGTVRFTGGTLRYGSGITTDLSSRIGNSTGAIAIDTNGNNVTFASNLANTNTGGLTKSGAGSLTLSGTNSYTGTTTIAGGTLVANSGTALGPSGNITFTGGTLQYGSGITTDYSSRIANSTGAIAIDTNGNNVTFASSIANTNSGGLTKTGTGTLTLTQANNYTGTTTLSDGILNLRNNTAAGSGTITVANGTTLQVQGGNVNVANAITVDGGTLESVSGANNKFGGNITLNASSTIRSSTGGQTLFVGSFLTAPNTTSLALNGNTLTVDGAGDITFNANIGGVGDAGSFVSNSTGTVRFYNYANTYTGTTTINSGTLLIDSDPSSLYNNQTIRGNLIIGNGTDAATVRYASTTGNNRIADSSVVTINAGSTLDMNGKFDTIGGLNLTDATITLGSAVLTLKSDPGNGISGDVNVFGGTSSISGYQFALTTDSSTRNINIADGATLNLGAQVTTGALTKNDGGTLILSGNNIYSGATTINDGVVNIQHNNALGTTVGSTSVASGAELQIQGNGLNVGEAVTLNGTGVTTGGALRNLTGDNTWSGNVTLGSAARINADTWDHDANGGTAPVASSLTISGGVVLNGNQLNMGGAGNTRIDGVVSNGSGTGSLVMDGTGTLTLTGSNNYSGTTTVTSGTVNIRNNDALGSTAAGTTVAAAGTLEIQGNITVGAEALSLAGTLRNVSGTNTYGGAISGAGAINVDAGSLTLSGSGGTFSGDATVADLATLGFGANNVFNSSGIDVNLSGADSAMSLVQYAQTIGTLAGLGEVNFGSGGSLTLLGNTTFGGSFAGTGTLIVGSGVTLTLGADFSAAGVTIVLAGGTLNLNGSTSTFAGLSLTGNSIIDFDAADDSMVTFTNLSLGSYTLAVHGWADVQDYFFVTNSPGTRGSPPLNQVTFGPSGGPPWDGSHTTWQPWDTQVTPVPEPSTYGAMLMGAGLALFGLRRWRQRRAARA